MLFINLLKKKNDQSLSALWYTGKCFLVYILCVVVLYMLPSYETLSGAEIKKLYEVLPHIFDVPAFENSAIMKYGSETFFITLFMMIMVVNSSGIKK